MTQKIDVLIPVYNGAKTIRSSIASIQQQTVQDIRIVVVNDGSTDDTLTILNEIASTEPRLHIITQPNAGIVDALNAGLAQCQAEFIARHDADDIAYPERFAKQIEYLNANPQCIAVSSGARHIDEHDQPTGTRMDPKPPSTADATWVPSREPYLLHPFLMIRRDTLVKVNGYRECPPSEDSDLYWRLQEIGELDNMMEILGDYRMHAESISGKSIRNGRRMALGSQLATLSALRRRAGNGSDIVFDKARVKAHASAESLEEFYRMGSDGLTEDELLRLRLGMAAKLIELTSYRPFELDAADCVFIKKAIREGDHLLNEDNRIELEGHMLEASFRLIKKRMYKEFFLLSWPKLRLKVAYRGLLSKAIREQIKVFVQRLKKS